MSELNDLDALIAEAMQTATKDGRTSSVPSKGRRRNKSLATEEVGWMPVSREARASVRGRAQTSYWKARKVAEDSLKVTKVAPKATHPEQSEAIAAERALEIEVFGDPSRVSRFPNWKPKVPHLIAKLEQKAFQSNEDFLLSRETPGPYDEPSEQEMRRRGQTGDSKTKQKKRQAAERRETNERDIADLVQKVLNDQEWGE